MIHQKVSLRPQNCPITWGRADDAERWFERAEKIREAMQTQFCVSPSISIVLPDGTVKHEAEPIDENDFVSEHGEPARVLFQRALAAGRILENYRRVEPAPKTAKTK